MKKLFCFFSILGLVLSVTFVVKAATFPMNGATPVNIPDNNPTGVSRTFTVSGVNGIVGGVRLTLNLTHTWIGDLRITLTSPDGEVHTIFHDVGDPNYPTGFGDSSNLSGAYVFRDDAVDTIWTGALGGTSNFVIPPGNYRTVGFNVNTATNMSATFGYPGPARFQDIISGKYFIRKLGYISPQVANGTWTLVVSDNQLAETGTINAGTQLELFNPTAASVQIAGRVVSHDGRPIAKVRVTVQEPGGISRAALTNAFGYYAFDDLQAGQAYVLTVAKKGYSFAEPSILVTAFDSMADVNFVSLP